MPALRTTSLLALVLVTPALLGCLDQFPFFGSDAEASAAELYPVAKEKATAWREGAVFVGTAAMESGAGQEDYGDNFSNDEKVGNGKAPGWIYAFTDPATQETLEVAVNAENETVVFVEESDHTWSGTTVTKATPWAVDSDDAVKTALKNASFARGVANASSPGWMLVLAPDGDDEEDANDTDGEDDPDSVWAITVWDEDGEGGGIAIVDAVTGHLVWAAAWDDMWQDWDAEWEWEWDWESNWSYAGFASKETYHEASHDGQLTALEPEAVFTFPYDHEDATASIQLCYGQRTPTGTIVFQVVAEDGTVVREADTSSSAAGSGRSEWTTQDLDVGEYTVHLMLAENGVAADYQLEVWVGEPGFEWEFDWSEWAGGC